MIPERWEETGEWKKIENPNMFYFYFTDEDLKLCLIIRLKQKVFKYKG